MDQQRSSIIQVLQQLSTSGEAVTVAKVKRRLASPVPMPMLLEMIAQFKAGELTQLDDPIPDQMSDEPAPSTEQRVQQLEQQVTELKAEVARLSQLIRE